MREKSLRFLVTPHAHCTTGATNDYEASVDAARACIYDVGGPKKSHTSLSELNALYTC